MELNQTTPNDIIGKGKVETEVTVGETKNVIQDALQNFQGLYQTYRTEFMIAGGVILVWWLMKK